MLKLLRICARRTVPALAAGLLMLAALDRAGTGAAAADLTQYAYKDTRKLVSLVEDAASLIETRGEAAFDDFGQPGSRWLSGETYMFVYDETGTSVFHPISPELEGKNVLGLKDMDGKPIIQEIVDVARQPGPDANGWVFYLWQNQRQITPGWKASYVRKVVTPQGKTYLVGSGLYDVKVEKTFVVERVNRACKLLATVGRQEAFRQIQSISSPFVFLDTYVFVLGATGQTLVDPAFPNMSGRDMLAFKDAVGFEPIKHLFDKLKTSDEAWVQFLLPKPGAVVPSRKLVYARKVTVNGETLIVGSDFFIATPIWMRVEREPQWPPNPKG